MYASQNIAATIENTAERKGIALNAMLSELGLDESAVAAMSRGKNISVQDLARIADYMNCSVDYLLGRNAEQETAALNAGDGPKEIEWKIMEQVKKMPLQQKIIFLALLNMSMTDSESVKEETEVWVAAELSKYV